MRNKVLRNKRVLSAALFVLLMMAGMTDVHAQGNAPIGAINGLFSVSENTQVYFSQGNLQYQASTHTWRFAESQWDFVGEDNANISPVYDGWIDLFGWGTSGNNHGAVRYQPWSTSENSGDYYAYGNWQANLFEQTGQADWGINAISNGGNQPNQWRTLTKWEWECVFNTRTTASGIRYAKAQVNNVNGVILLPDNWDSSLFALSETNQGGASYNSNVITSSDWFAVFEPSGAVFLPAAGYRISKSLGDLNYGARYWSASFQDSENSIYTDFGTWYLYSQYAYGRILGGSVRLVRPTQANTSYTIEAVPNPAQGGTITGAGTYNYYNQVTLTANASEGYTFYQWKENGNVISMENPISFVALFNRSLEACFLESSTYPLLYSFNENDRTATVTGFWDGYDAAGDLTIPETVMHNGEVYTVTTIGESAFYGRSEITSVEFPNTLISIAYGAFEACEGITEVVIPSSVTSIGEGPFMWCRNLVQITVEPGNTYYDSRDNCYAIIETATNKLVAGSLSTIIPPTVTSIGLGAFGGLQISSITIPALVNHIRDNAFIGASLSSIIVLAEMPPFAGACAFCVADRNIPVYVPCGSLDAYQNDGGWNEFPNFIEMCPGTITVTANPAEFGTVIGGGSFEGGETCTVTATPNEGYFFSYWSENGRMVSAETTYSFIVTGNRDLIANFYTLQPGMINGLFSVSADRMVCFSQGNLQYQASTNTWQFAEHQWDFVGEGNVNASSTYDGWIDLFCYGTSGYNHGAVCCQPWSTSMNNNDYWAYGNGVFNLLDMSGEADWGYNPISNGGNVEGIWRTMTIGEWDYMLNYRLTTSGIRFVTANVNGFNGWILLPDNWETSWFVLNYTNDMWASYENNVISLADWNAVFESHGAVFLPIAGCKHGQSEIDYGRGDYWSSSNMYYEDLACSVSNGGLSCERWRCDANSIRLVQFVQTPSFAINSTPNQEGYGTINGTDIYELGQTCTLTASPNEGYTFLNWKVNGATVSTENPYTFVVRYDRSLEAVFYENSTYPLTYSYNEYDHTATLTGRVNDMQLTGELNIPETVMHNGESYTVTTIGGYSFYGCSGLTGSLTIPNTVTGIGDEAFNFCSGFTGELVIPNSVTYIGWGAFSDCNGFNSIDMGTSVTHIGGYAFNGCSNVASLELSNSLTDIGDWAFNGCSSLTSVVFPNSLNFIREWAFRSCHGLTEVVIPSSVTSIGINPFANCSNLAQITVESGNYYYDSRDNCNAIIETGTNTLVSGSQNTIIPNTVTHIGQDAFNEILVSSITIPASVNYIGIWAIANIPTLSTITVLAENPPTLDDCTFCEVNKSIPMYVPCGFVDAYQNAWGWNEFTNIQEGWYDIELSTNTVEGGIATGGGDYCLGSTCTVTAEANEDFYFVNWTEDGEIVSTELSYSFTVANNRTLVANFEESHWNAESYENYMFMIGVVQIDGVEQASPALELGAFCNGECRGTKSPVYDEGQWLYFMNIGGNAGDEITFRLYDHVLQQELNLYCFNVLPFEVYGLIGIDESYEILFASTLSVSVVVNPENAGTIEGVGEYPLGAEATLTATANEGYVFNSWTLDGEVVSTEPSYTFTVTAPVSLTANFDVLYSVSINVNLENAGTVTGEGEYLYGTSVTVTATPEEGYVFNSWTLDGEIVSTEPSYTFTVTESVSLTANFDVVRTQQLVMGWNWWSTDLEITLDDLKAALVATGNTSLLIKSQGETTFYTNGRWKGNLSWDVANMYKIKVGTACEITLEGTPVNPEEHPATIRNGFNWIAFPFNQSMSINAAMAGFPAVSNDLIKSSTNNTIFIRGAWRGALTTFAPGQGYIFKSVQTEDRTLTFPSSAK